MSPFNLHELRLQLQLQVCPTSVLEDEDPSSGQILLVGSAHTSKASAEDTAKCVAMVQPDGLFLELCSEREKMLTIDKGAFMEHIKTATTSSIFLDIASGRTHAFVGMYTLLMRAMAQDHDAFPAGEFRAAYDAMRHLPPLSLDRRVLLGDRPLSVTIARFWRGMGVWERFWLMFEMLFGGFLALDTDYIRDSLDSLQKDSDLLTKAVQEFGVTFPWLKEALVSERDRFMTAQLKQFLQSTSAQYGRPVKILAVVGAGHMQGIQQQWLLPVAESDLHQISTLPTEQPAKAFQMYVKQRLTALAKEHPEIRHAQLRQRKWLSVTAASLAFLLYLNRTALLSKCISAASRLFRK